MNNLIRCLVCKNIMIGEEYANHTCDPIHFKGIRDIEVTYWYESKHKDGQRMVFGLGSDGYTYRMIELKAGFEEIDPHQPTSNTNNNSREDNSTILWVLSSLWDIKQL